jgi:phosphoglycolate phosphatase-like HAD superfamily hydrolase
MPTATTAFHNRLAIVFDFDDTLAPDSYDTLLEHLGVDPDRFEDERVKPLSDSGWDDTLARFHCIIQEAQQRDDLTLDQDFCRRVGEAIEPFPGVPEMFDQVRDWANAIADDVDVEFYLLSAGFVDVHRHMDIAEHFSEMWGSEFYFGDDGTATWCKQMITFSEKVRYVLQLAKGVGTEGENEPREVYRDVPAEDWHVPLDQVVYVGDGASDMPVFELMREHGGMAIGVFEKSPDQWDALDSVNQDRRVQNLASADYSEGAELMESLRLAVESICKRIELRRQGKGE